MRTGCDSQLVQEKCSGPFPTLRLDSRGIHTSLVQDETVNEIKDALKEIYWCVDRPWTELDVTMLSVLQNSQDIKDDAEPYETQSRICQSPWLTKMSGRELNCTLGIIQAD